MKVVKIPWKAWYGDEMFELVFPDEWNLNVFSMNDAPGVEDEDIREAFSNPIGTEPLRSIAKGKKTAVIVVDDLSRPTPAYKILPSIAKELKEAGVKEKDITIIMGLGAHRPMLRKDLINKLGRSIYDSFPVYNHHPFENLVHLGTSSRGTPIHINRLFMNADVKIGIGCIMPHNYAGFGGGGKIVLPGISGIDTLKANHESAIRGIKGGLGLTDGNEVRDDIEEIARKVGLDFIVNVVVNSKREIAGIFAGDIVTAHREGVILARRGFATGASSDLDVGVFNAYPKDTDLIQAANAFNPYLSTRKPIVKKNGTIVITTASVEGEGYHSLEGPYMRLFEYVDEVAFIRNALEGRTVYLFSPHLNEQEVHKCYSSSVVFFDEWEELIETLRRRFSLKCKVGIFPCASTQLIS